MIDTANIIRLRNKRDKQLDEYQKENREAYSHLNFFQRNKFTKIKEMIYTITLTIERESGWQYTPSRFTCYSDFKYTGKEIIFKINSVFSSDKGYHLSDNPTPKEIEFYTKYQGLLQRLFTLEQKRQALLPKKISNIIPLDSLTPKEQRIKDNQDLIFTENFVNALAADFVREYKSEGIQELIRLLNGLVDAEEVMKEYPSLHKGIIPTLFDHEALKFAGLYTPRGQQVLDELARQRVEKSYMLNGFPSYEERMTRNMIDLHL